MTDNLKFENTFKKKQTATIAPIVTPAVQTPPAAKPVLRPHVYFALPCYGGLIYESCFMSLLRFTTLAARAGLEWTVDTMVNESLIPRGRNNLVAKFLSNPQATHLMFIDADIRWQPEYIFKMLETNKDVVCGLYPMKCVPPKFVINAIPNSVKEGQLEEVSTAGTGFMMIKRQCIESMVKAYPETKYNDNIRVGKEYEPNMYALFDCSIDSDKNYLSEDWTFCYRWRKLGNKVWVHKDIILDHQGTYTFRGAEAAEHHNKLAAEAEQAARKANG